MVTLLALADVHVSVVDSPEVIVAGEAPSVTVGTGGGVVVVTVTVAVRVTDPDEFVAVSV